MAKKAVYSEPILNAVRGTPGLEKVAPIELSDVYLRQAGDEARRRVIAAGIRLGILLGGKTPPDNATADAADSAKRPTNAIEVIRARLVRVRTAGGLNTKTVLVDWKNIGAATVRAVDANIILFDARGRKIDIRGRGDAFYVRDYAIYAVSDSSPGIAPGETYTEPSDRGFIVEPDDAEIARRVRVEITEVVETGAY